LFLVKANIKKVRAASLTSMVTLNREYNKGILKNVKLANEPVWQLPSMNKYGQITSYKLGNQLVTKGYDSHGFLSGIDYDNDYYLLYDFDANNGNLNGVIPLEI
jgi:hypothetical protein